MYYPNPLPRSPYVMHVLKKQHIFNQIDEEIVQLGLGLSWTLKWASTTPLH